MKTYLQFANEATVERTNKLQFGQVYATVRWNDETLNLRYYGGRNRVTLDDGQAKAALFAYLRGLRKQTELNW